MPGKPPYRSLTSTQECSFQSKNSFFVAGQHWCRATFFYNLPAQITRIIEVLLAKWNGKLIAVSFFLNLTPLGLSHIKKAGSEACQIHVEKWILHVRSLFNGRWKIPYRKTRSSEFASRDLNYARFLWFR